MSLAPTDRKIRSICRSAWRRLAAVIASRSSGTCALTVPWQVTPVRVTRHSRARCEPSRPWLDGRAGAGERQEGDGDVRMADGERQRCARLVAVERAVAGGVRPLRVEALPGREPAAGAAALVALEAGAAGPEVLAAAEIVAEAEAAARQFDRPVRIAFAGGDGVAEARDQDVAHLDFLAEALGHFRAGIDVDGDDRRLRRSGTRMLIGSLQSNEDSCARAAAVEPPRADGAGGNLAGEANGDVVLGGRQIILGDVVARAGLADAACLIDAQPRKRVARPAAAVALNGQRLLGLRGCCGSAQRFDVQLEVALLLEQAEAVAHLPADLHRAAAGRLCVVRRQRARALRASLRTAGQKIWGEPVIIEAALCPMNATIR